MLPVCTLQRLSVNLNHNLVATQKWQGPGWIEKSVSRFRDGLKIIFQNERTQLFGMSFQAIGPCKARKTNDYEAFPAC
jgi:hypothetical protein